MHNSRKFLLDTHILLWWLGADDRLSDKFLKVISSQNNVIYVSVINLWEMVLKQQLGKLSFPNNLEEAIEDSGFLILPLKLKHVTTIRELENIHKDPFDRMLISQAIAEDITLITADQKMTRYKSVTILH